MHLSLKNSVIYFHPGLWPSAVHSSLPGMHPVQTTDAPIRLVLTVKGDHISSLIKKSYLKYYEMWRIISNTLASFQDILMSGRDSGLFIVSSSCVDNTETSLCPFLCGTFHVAQTESRAFSKSLYKYVAKVR